MIFTRTNSTTFKKEFVELLGRGKVDIAHVSGIVGGIIDEIKKVINKESLRVYISFKKRVYKN